MSWEEGPVPRKDGPVVASGLSSKEGRERQ